MKANNLPQKRRNEWMILKWIEMNDIHWLKFIESQDEMAITINDNKYAFKARQSKIIY